MSGHSRLSLLAGFVCLASTLFQAPPALAQAPPADAGPVIRAETRLVIVDTVVTDKKGAYIHDLTAQKFRVSEDGKEHNIKHFSFEADAAHSPAKRHYLVLFFENSCN